MLEYAKVAKEIAEKSREIRSYVPEFLIKEELRGESRSDIVSPVSKKDEIKKPKPYYESTDKTSDDDLEDLISDDSDDELIDMADEIEALKFCPVDGHGGEWDTFRGNSKWKPYIDEIPKKNNPDNLTWEEILDEYGIDGIEYKNGEPDFAPVSKGTVEIDSFTDKRQGKGNNFDQATQKLAEQRGCTPEEVKTWMKENKYTWHECSDCKTMQKVPSVVHGNIWHSGGISEMKSNNSENKEN